MAEATGDPAPPRLLALGDSLTGGSGLEPRDGLVPVLSDWLAARGRRVEILNAGEAGDTTSGGRDRIDRLLDQNVDAVMVELGGNDMLMGLGPEQAEANLDAILSRAGANGRPVLLVGIQAPPGDAAWRQAWAELWPRLAGQHEVVLLPDLYAPLVALPADELAQMLQRDGLHPSAKGVRLIVEALGPKVETLLGQLDDTAAAAE
ncbi:arylesterase [Paracoccus sp. XHP0099]|uniref:Arylesterase n=2 Tax=Paracoccus marinaquae TaxID=2841926 RepID=A0ABS6AD97_9RHOB|nr:arylesterase [Paracoccus marinaquae]